MNYGSYDCWLVLQQMKDTTSSSTETITAPKPETRLQVLVRPRILIIELKETRCTTRLRCQLSLSRSLQHNDCNVRSSSSETFGDDDDDARQQRRPIGAPGTAPTSAAETTTATTYRSTLRLLFVQTTHQFMASDCSGVFVV
jgi:hypothetical protein